MTTTTPKRMLPMLGLTVLLLSPGGTALASDDYRYGHQLMSDEELAEHRQRMRSFDNDAAREQYRYEHHERMRERAESQRLYLPDEPQSRGQRSRYGRGRARSE